MTTGAPMPPVANSWSKSCYPCAEGWATPYAAYINMFRGLVSNDVATQDTMHLDSDG